MGTGPWPLGVTIIGILQMLVGLPLVVLAATFLIGGAFATTFAGPYVPDWIDALIGAGAAFFAILFLGFAVILFLLGNGSLHGQGWAWTITMILSVLNVVLFLLSVMSFEPEVFLAGVPWAALNAFIVWYYYTPDVKAFFGKTTMRAMWQKAPA